MRSQTTEFLRSVLSGAVEAYEKGEISEEHLHAIFCLFVSMGLALYASRHTIAPDVFTDKSARLIEELAEQAGIEINPGMVITAKSLLEDEGFHDLRKVAQDRLLAFHQQDIATIGAEQTGNALLAYLIGALRSYYRLPHPPLELMRKFAELSRSLPQTGG